jgi:hypothetical protein
VDAVLDGGVFRFKLSDNGQARSVAVPRSSYDFTTMDCPETTISTSSKTPPVIVLFQLAALRFRSRPRVEMCQLRAFLL